MLRLYVGSSQFGGETHATPRTAKIQKKLDTFFQKAPPIALATFLVPHIPCHPFTAPEGAGVVNVPRYQQPQ